MDLACCARHKGVPYFILETYFVKDIDKDIDYSLCYIVQNIGVGNFSV